MSSEPASLDKNKDEDKAQEPDSKEGNVDLETAQEAEAEAEASPLTAAGLAAEQEEEASPPAEDEEDTYTEELKQELAHYTLDEQFVFSFAIFLLDFSLKENKQKYVDRFATIFTKIITHPTFPGNKKAVDFYKFIAPYIVDVTRGITPLNKALIINLKLDDQYRQAEFSLPPRLRELIKNKSKHAMQKSFEGTSRQYKRGIEKKVEKLHRQFGTQVPVGTKMERFNQEVRQTCQNCGRLENKGEKFKFCARCKGPAYCSPECQKANWKEHKKTCAAASFPMPTSGGTTRRKQRKQRSRKRHRHLKRSVKQQRQRIHV